MCCTLYQFICQFLGRKEGKKAQKPVQAYLLKIIKNKGLVFVFVLFNIQIGFKPHFKAVREL